MPLGPAVHIAAGSPDLLGGRGEYWSQGLVERFEGEGIAFARDAASGMIINPTGSDGGTPTLEKTMTFTLPGIEAPKEDLFVSLQLRADPLEEYSGSIGRSASIGRRVYVTAVPGVGRNPGTEDFTWANEKSFTATFYFKDIGPGSVDLSFEVEGERPLYFEKLTAHSATNARYREFENGVVFANPSTRPYTFDLARLFPGASLRRLRGSENQDPETNNGRPLGEELTLGPKDALFVVRGGGRGASTTTDGHYPSFRL
jgi:hypothetical protein